MKQSYSLFRQQEINRWFEMFKKAEVLEQSQYHDFCKWAKSKKQGEVFVLIHKKQNPLR
ncbi:hypothetical protein D3C87_666240 [compost metagenome]